MDEDPRIKNFIYYIDKYKSRKQLYDKFCNKENGHTIGYEDFCNEEYVEDTKNTLKRATSLKESIERDKGKIPTNYLNKYNAIMGYELIDDETDRIIEYFNELVNNFCREIDTLKTKYNTRHTRPSFNIIEEQAIFNRATKFKSEIESILKQEIIKDNKQITFKELLIHEESDEYTKYMDSVNFYNQIKPELPRSVKPSKRPPLRRSRNFVTNRGGRRHSSRRKRTFKKKKYVNNVF